MMMEREEGLVAVDERAFDFILGHGAHTLGLALGWTNGILSCARVWKKGR